MRARIVRNRSPRSRRRSPSSGGRIPILVGADGIVIAGHARLLAARKLGMTEVPVIVLDHLTETQRRALVLADNRLALNAGWDEEMLRVELAALEEDGFNLDLVGFTDDEIEGSASRTRKKSTPATPTKTRCRRRRRPRSRFPAMSGSSASTGLLCGDCDADGCRGEGPGRRPGRHGLHAIRRTT